MNLNMTLIVLSIVLKVLIIIIPLLIAVAYFTLAERKIMGSIQRRKGPNVVGFLGLLQALADGLKLFVKETILPPPSKPYPSVNITGNDKYNSLGWTS
jgi:NADH:ubiquinone oxidoreductase subunit H